MHFYARGYAKWGSNLPTKLKLEYSELSPVRNMRREIEGKLEIDAYDIYGLSEIIDPELFMNAQENGLHIAEDHFIPEIIDPETCEVLPEVRSELVLTTVTKALPIIRYRPGFKYLNRSVCEWQNPARMAKVLGRSDDMVIIRGLMYFLHGGKCPIEYTGSRTSLSVGSIGGATWTNWKSM